MANVKTTYVEPADYFPKEIRKKWKLGEYAEDEKKAERKKENKEFRDYVKNKD